MSTLLGLRHISKFLKHTTPPRICCNHFKTPFAIEPIPSMITQVKTLTQRQQTPSPTSEEWRVIYRLPLIRLASAFNRVKIPYGLLTALVVPLAFVLESSSHLPPNIAGVVSSVGITSLMSLAICSVGVKNLVGIIYINDSNDRLKLAYVDYWGKRRDVFVNLDDLVPESEKRKPSKLDFYQTLTLYSDDKVKYKLLTKYGTIEDPRIFVGIFGE